MKHLLEALSKHGGSDLDYIKVEDQTVSFKIQDGPIKEVGLNGVQAEDIVIFAKNLVESLNDAFPCRENALMLTKLDEAIHWSMARTFNREKRGVEGKSEA